MAKPDPRLLDPAQYRFSVPITTRFADLDPNDHLNNVAIAAMFEDARVRLSLALGFRPDRTPGGRRFVVAAVDIAYLAEGRFPDPITCYAAPLVIGRSSWTLHQVLIQQDRPVATAKSVLVSIIDDRPAPLDPAMAAKLGEWMLA
jgi:acyl-CoA thioester hydrolase